MKTTNDKTNLPAKTNEEVLAAKFENWGKLGLKTHNLAFELENDSNAIKAALTMPQTIEQINATEAALKVAKQKTNELVNKRKAVTSLIEVPFSKLMAFEKDLSTVYIPGIEQQLIKLKKDKATKDALEQAKTDEKRRLKEESIKWVNDYDLLFKTEINKKVAGALQYALGVGNVTAEALPEYIKERVLTVFKPIQFVTPMYKAVLKNVTHDEFVAIWDEVKAEVKEPVFYVGAETSLFEMEVAKQFEFYDAALLNKEGAIKQSQGIEAKNDEQLKKENATSNIAATMQSMATATTATVAGEKTKALKQKFELDMESNEQNALLIISAFVANLDMARTHVKADWFKLTVMQMGAALVAIKNNDNKFESTGIKFKIVDKL